MFNKKTIQALEEFTENLYWSKLLSKEQSINNLEKSLVEVLFPNKNHMGNGLLITEDGYFLTAGHMLEGEPPRYIKDYQGRIYSIKGACQTDEKEDLALFRAEISKEELPKKYKIYNTENLKNFKAGEFPITLKSRWNGQIANKSGSVIVKYVIDETFGYSNQFGTDIHSITGDSGGVIISDNGELMGFASTGFKEEGEFEIWNKQIIRSYYSKILSGLNLIKREINSLKGF